MLNTRLHLPEYGIRDELLPRLRGHVFHVSKLQNRDAIIKAGALFPGKGRGFVSTFGYTKSSFFHQRDCISLFDYRTVAEDELETSLGKCSPWTGIDYQSESPGLAIFFLPVNRLPPLLPWTLRDEEGTGKEQVIAHVEVGHKGPIPLTMVDEILSIDVEIDKKSPAYIIAQARRKHL